MLSNEKSVIECEWVDLSAVWWYLCGSVMHLHVFFHNKQGHLTEVTWFSLCFFFFVVMLLKHHSNLGLYVMSVELTVCLETHKLHPDVFSPALRLSSFGAFKDWYLNILRVLFFVAAVSLYCLLVVFWSNMDEHFKGTSWTRFSVCFNVCYDVLLL